MTCIVGVVAGGTVYLGGDSAGSNGSLTVVRSDAKVFRKEPRQGEAWVLGYTSSFRMGQVLRFSLKIPERGEERLFDFMCTSFIDAVRDCLKKAGFAEKEKEAETGGQFLVGHAGHLFFVGSDYQVGEMSDGYFAVGCGDAIALGSLYSTEGRRPDYRISAALEAAEHFSTGVRGPFVMENA